MRSCLVYQIRGRRYVVAEQLTVVGWRTPCLPVYSGPCEDYIALGHAVVESIEHFRCDAPRQEVVDRGDPVLHEMGVESWEEIASPDVKLVHVEENDEKFRIVPTHGDENGGFSPDYERSIGLGKDAVAIGMMVHQMFVP